MKTFRFVCSLIVLAVACSACGAPASVPGGEEIVDRTAVRDNSSAIQISVPYAWQATDGVMVEMASKRFAAIAASTDLTGFAEFTAPGAYLLVNAGLAGAEQSVAEWQKTYTAEPQGCAFVSQAAYDDGTYAGQIVFLQNCRGTQNALAVVVANPLATPDAYTLTLTYNAVPAETPAALTAAVADMLATFMITGVLP